MIFSKWWALVLRGIAAIIFGLFAFLLPGITVGVLIILFAAYALVDGVFSIAAAINRTDRSGHWGAMLLRGILGILASIAAMAYPGMTALVLLYLIAAWAIVTGILEISAAIRLRKVITGEWMLVVAGILSILFGLGLGTFPGPGILAVVWLIGTYAVLFGAVMVALGLSLRARGREVEVERRAA
jgi:uncharacterized membrane protein HdeD (DUF308 family)